MGGVLLCVWLSVTPGTTSEAEHVYELIAQGEYARADEVLSALSGDEGTLAILWGALEAVREDYTKAATWFEKASTFRPQDASIRLHWARALLMLDRPKEAMRVLNAVDFKEHPRAALLMAHGFQKLGNVRAVYGVLFDTDNDQLGQEDLAIHRAIFLARHGLCGALRQYAQERSWKQAQWGRLSAAYEACALRIPYLPLGWETLRSTHAARAIRGRMAARAGDSRQAVRLLLGTPDNAQYLAAQHLALGNTASAWRHTIRITQTFLRTKQRLAIHLAAGEFEQAAAMESWFDLRNGRNPEICYSLALANVHAGDDASAQRLANQCLSGTKQRTILDLTRKNHQP